MLFEVLLFVFVFSVVVSDVTFCVAVLTDVLLSVLTLFVLLVLVTAEFVVDVFTLVLAEVD